MEKITLQELHKRELLRDELILINTGILYPWEIFWRRNRRWKLVRSHLFMQIGEVSCERGPHIMFDLLCLEDGRYWYPTKHDFENTQFTIATEEQIEKPVFKG